MNDLWRRLRALKVGTILLVASAIFFGMVVGHAIERKRLSMLGAWQGKPLAQVLVRSQQGLIGIAR